MLYRIITENTNKEAICRIVALSFDGFTVYEATGYYSGTQELALIIEIAVQVSAFDFKAKRYYKKCILNVCRIIRISQSQECVLLQQIKSKSEFI